MKATVLYPFKDAMLGEKFEINQTIDLNEDLIKKFEGLGLVKPVAKTSKAKKSTKE